ncbi:MAG: radical SAM protein [Candidatus Firestonebacteria bacterium]|nr:radical SAM protein [Candidatus Firestonebacteria bacterium]
MSKTQINEVEINRILNPTSIDLGEYVINPYSGCEFSCLYCYARSSTAACKKNRPWGEYLDIRINAPELLEKELQDKKPETVLLGSTTECFQPIENKYLITKKILEILNKHKVNYIILTRSPFILNYLNILEKGYCKKIYFTINKFEKKYKISMEPESPQFNLRINAINTLLDAGIPIVPYFSPILPWISDFENIFLEFDKAQYIEFECLNFRLKNINEIINKINEINPVISSNYRKMLEDKRFYDNIWKEIKNSIDEKARVFGRKYKIYVHAFGSYFENKYSLTS